ncbi:arylsulfatase [Pedobacter sp. SD-b]|uniref:Arylsulfatase n=1 Tax=Pedobacter segetis TaxID=2793069 RepID=A0ABS1BLN3_9SPHI|nr:arylsulfatase [Pedobacter segetis]MBK0383697.1 arylsulfatase [Pedobacter segetis]
MKYKTKNSLKMLFVLMPMLLCVTSDFAQTKKPNIIFILADDLGYSDVGAYGGEIHTPNLDKMAEEGVKLTNMHNASMCILSRSSLLTGKWWPKAGKGITNGENIAQQLKKEGYHTGLVGKWHLNGEPNDKGFDYFFGYLSGFSNYFKGSPDYRSNRVPFKNFPADYYSTDYFTDRAIDFINPANNKGKPFFLYLSFQSPHNPLQAPKEDIMKYRGSYLKGWQAVREARLKRQIQLGIVDAGTPVPAYPLNLPSWDSLTPRQKDLEDLRMSVYAAMVERMDKGIGRLLGALKKNRQAGNTFVVFLSDNGTDSFSVVDKVMLKRGLLPGDVASNYQPGTGWAYAAVTPYRLYKISQNGGGITTGAIAWGPGIFKQSGTSINNALHIVDVVPTVLDMVNAENITTSFKDSLSGKSFYGLLNGGKFNRKGPMYFQYRDNRAIRTNSWDLVEVDEDGWELYDIKRDPYEADDLSGKYPEVVKSLSANWLNWWKTENHTNKYVPESTKHDYNYKPQGDRGSGALYIPSAMPDSLSHKYPLK